MQITLENNLSLSSAKPLLVFIYYWENILVPNEGHKSTYSTTNESLNQLLEMADYGYGVYGIKTVVLIQ